MEGVEVGVTGGGGSVQMVVAELVRVQGLLRQLELHLGAPCSVELCRGLAAEIIALTDRSIGIVTSSSGGGGTAAHFADTPPALASCTPSPLSDVSDHQPFRTNPKKRKTTARWTSQVRVSAAGGAEGPADDGHSWRKYGQKDILGAKHPRGYYRCTHRNTQGCTATKQVQRTDDDASLFDVVYHGEHTCRPAAAAAAKRPHAQTLLQSLSATLTVNTDTSGLLSAGAVTPLTPEDRPAAAPPQSVSPSLASPVASDSYGLAAAYGDWPHCCDGDLQEVVSALATVTSAPEHATIDADFMSYCFDFSHSYGGIGTPDLFP
ncbi:transcription factor WRKY19-like [Oryza brachyantha]|uniref:transcription factor WRKY19-like n=1 Tax=Oryza brachyantha TaxID=4533 RepID=UPI001ADA99F0|nr:transcription factor WRKY19-like [Oryza brachyantha]